MIDLLSMEKRKLESPTHSHILLIHIVSFRHGMGLSTGIDLEKLLEAGQFICNVLGRPSLSKVGMAASASSKKSYSYSS